MVRNCTFGIMNRNGWQKRPPRVAEPSSTNLVGDFSGSRMKRADTRSALHGRSMIMFNALCSHQSEAQWNYLKAQEDSPFQLMTCVGSVFRKYDKTWEVGRDLMTMDTELAIRELEEYLAVLQRGLVIVVKSADQSIT
jgi:hypothetical protein